VPKARPGATCLNQTVTSIVSVHRFRVQRSGLGKKLKGTNGNPRKMWILPHNYQCDANFQIGSDKARRFHINTPSKWSLDTRIQPLNP